MLRNQPKWIQRLAVIALVAVAALLARTLAVSLFDVEFVSQDELGKADLDVSVRAVFLVSAFAGLAGWAALEILERGAIGKARIVWLVGSLAFYAATLAPVLAWDMPGDSKVTLAILHTLVAVIYIPLMLRTARTDLLKK
jgi:hypothetical protein